MFRGNSSSILFLSYFITIVYYLVIVVIKSLGLLFLLFHPVSSSLNTYKAFRTNHRYILFFNLKNLYFCLIFFVYVY